MNTEAYFDFSIKRLQNGYSYAIASHSNKVIDEISRPFTEREVYYIMKQKGGSTFRKSELIHVLNSLHEHLDNIQNQAQKRLKNETSD